MDQHALDYFRPYSEDSPHTHFHRVIALHDEPLSDWKEVSELAPDLSRGWYELALLPSQDRIEFTRDFWCDKFCSRPEFVEFLLRFFKSIDDIGIFLTQQKFDDPLRAQCVYSLKDDSGFFQGFPPANDAEIASLKKAYPDYLLPDDYLDFMRIHNGFGKQTDTGLTQTAEMELTNAKLQEALESGDPLRTTGGTLVNPKSLIPFYRSFNMPFYQCFWGEWYPDQGMGNVYYSGLTHTISDYKLGIGVDTMAFATFTDWLMFYLETID